MRIIIATADLHFLLKFLFQFPFSVSQEGGFPVNPGLPQSPGSQASAQTTPPGPQGSLSRQRSPSLLGIGARKANPGKGFQNPRPQSLGSNPFPVPSFLPSFVHPVNIYRVLSGCQALCWTIALGLLQRKGTSPCFQETYSQVMETDTHISTRPPACCRKGPI